jgi:hypothetical protein
VVKRKSLFVVVAVGVQMAMSAVIVHYYHLKGHNAVDNGAVVVGEFVPVGNWRIEKKLSLVFVGIAFHHCCCKVRTVKVA